MVIASNVTFTSTVLGTYPFPELVAHWHGGTAASAHWLGGSVAYGALRSFLISCPIPATDEFS